MKAKKMKKNWKLGEMPDNWFDTPKEAAEWARWQVLETIRAKDGLPEITALQAFANPPDLQDNDNGLVAEAMCFIGECLREQAKKRNVILPAREVTRCLRKWREYLGMARAGGYGWCRSQAWKDWNVKWQREHDPSER